MKITQNGQPITIYRHNPTAWKLPLNITGEEYYLDTNTTMGELCKAADLGTFDFALPQFWFDQYHQKFGRAPRGVWQYPKGSIMGRFCSLDEILERLADKIGCPTRPAHIWDEWGFYRLTDPEPEE